VLGAADRLPAIFRVGAERLTITGVPEIRTDHAACSWSRLTRYSNAEGSERALLSAVGTWSIAIAVVNRIHVGCQTKSPRARRQLKLRHSAWRMRVLCTGQTVLSSRAVTHDTVRNVLPFYAAARLTEPQADEVREHLVTGCSQCLDELFRLQRGIPRCEPEQERPTAAREPPARPSLAAVSAVMVIAVCQETAADVEPGGAIEHGSRLRRFSLRR